VSAAGAASALLCAGEQRLDIRHALGEAPLCQIEVAEHHGEHVVEVVRDAAGQLADRIHLLRLPQRVLGPLAPRHFVDQFVGALRDHLLERVREAAQILDRLVAFALAARKLADAATMARPTWLISATGSLREESASPRPSCAASSVSVSIEPASRPPTI
jgi:hypothetical protein